MEKLSPNRAHLFLRNKCSFFFTMDGTVALRSVNITLPKSYTSAAISRPFTGQVNNRFVKTVSYVTLFKKNLK